MRNSKQKDIVYNTLCENMIHPTADELYHIIRQKNSDIGVATVYRNLNKLSEKGIIRKITGLDGASHYDSNMKPHFHFVCTLCGCIKDIDFVNLDLLKQATDLQECNIMSVDITLRGYCKKCDLLRNDDTMSKEEKIP